MSALSRRQRDEQLGQALGQNAVHFHVCVVDKVFEALSDAESINAQSVSFHPAEIDDAAIAQVQANVRKRLLRAVVARGHLDAWRQRHGRLRPRRRLLG